MESNVIYIKNMVCPRCVMAVEGVLKDCGVPFLSVTLGEVRMTDALTDEKYEKVKTKLHQLGLEVLNDPKKQVVEQICTIVLEWVRVTNDRPRLSQFLQDKLNREYSSLSKLFSEVRGITIEQYMKLVRIERVKEELCYGELSIAELSYQLGFSSPAHLSSQFKSVTGMTPKEFQQLDNGASGKKRMPLDQI